MSGLVTSRAGAAAAAAFAGLVVGLALVPLQGIALALVIPPSFVAPFRAIGTPGLGIFLWDVLIYSVLGPGLLAFGMLLLLFRLTVQSRRFVAVFFLASVLLARYFLVPAYYGQPVGSALLRPWWGYAFELVLFFAAVAANALSKRRSGAPQVSPV